MLEFIKRLFGIDSEYNRIKAALGIRVKRCTKLDKLSLAPYTLGVLKGHGYKTVYEVIKAKTKLGKIAGIGKRSWTDFLNAIK